MKVIFSLDKEVSVRTSTRLLPPFLLLFPLSFCASLYYIGLQRPFLNSAESLFDFCIKVTAYENQIQDDGFHFKRTSKGLCDRERDALETKRN